MSCVSIRVPVAKPGRLYAMADGGDLVGVSIRVPVAKPGRPMEFTVEHTPVRFQSASRLQNRDDDNFTRLDHTVPSFNPRPGCKPGTTRLGLWRPDSSQVSIRVPVAKPGRRR